MFSRITPAVKNLIIINVLMLLAAWALSNYGINLDDHLALYYYQSPNFHVYQYFTYMFMHGGFLHLFFNMYALFLFGTALEQVWGSKRFLIFYFVTGIGAALFYTLVNHIEFLVTIKNLHAFSNTPSPELLVSFIKGQHIQPKPEWIDILNKWVASPNNLDLINYGKSIANEIVLDKINTPCVGASGAIFGVLLGFGMLFPNTVLMLLFPPIPIKAKYFVMIYGGIELYFAIAQPGSSIAHTAHLGGMLFGYFMIKMWNRDRKYFY